MIGLDDLCLATGGQLYGEATVREFTGITDDPAQVRAGSLFIVNAIPEAGQDNDIDLAIAAGAAGLLCETPPIRDVSSVTTVLVGDARLGLEQWAAFAIRQYHPLTMAVIGDSGRAAACDVISAALRALYPVYSGSGVPGPYQLPVAVGGLEPQHGHAIFDLAPDAFSSLNDMLTLLQPQILIITNPLSQGIGRVQPLLTLPEPIQQAVSRLPAKGIIVANAADRDLLAAIKPASLRLVTYTDNPQLTVASGQVDVDAEQVRFAVDGFVVNLRAGKDTFRDVRLPGIGISALSSALCALAACLALEFPVRDALATLSRRSSMGDLKLSPIADGAVMIDSCPSKPEAVFSLLDWLDQLGDQVRRRFLVLGDLKGGDDRTAEAVHAIGRRSTGSVDALIALDESTAPAVLAARRAGFSPAATLLPHQRDEAPEFLRSNIGQGDILIVASEHASATQLATKPLTAKSGAVPYPAQQSHTSVDLRPPPGERSWLEVDLRTLSENVSLVRRQLQDGVALIAVVKDGGYRHGAVETARIALRGGADMLAVSSVDEGITLRDAGLESPVLVLGYDTPDAMTRAIGAGLTIAIQSRTHAELLARASRRMKMRCECHIRVSGSVRDAGVPMPEVIALVRELKNADNINIDGLFIEFSPVPSASWAADSGRTLQQFAQIARNLSAAGVDIPYVHAAGSAAMLTLQSSIFSAARIGHMLYGVSPFATARLPAGLKPALTWKSVVVDIIVENARRGTAGTSRRLAVIPVGHKDGLIRPQRNQSAVLIDGFRAACTDASGPDWTFVDVTNAPSAMIGSEVVLIGAQGSDRITIEEIAAQRGCASYDVISALPAGMRRLYDDRRS